MRTPHQLHHKFTLGEAYLRRNCTAWVVQVLIDGVNNGYAL